VRNTQVLDVNSVYSYLMLCKLFPDTCVVAETAGAVVGFVSAFRSPVSVKTLFIWQVAVAKSQQGQGLATALLHELLERKVCEDICYLEATIAPSNAASQSLFRKLAKQYGLQCDVSDYFPKHLFPGSGHEAELLFRIGPMA